jgi:hypothetical protein
MVIFKFKGGKIMNLNTVNQIISNEKSKELLINIIVDGKTYTINTIASDFGNEVLKIYVDEEGAN